MELVVNQKLKVVPEPAKESYFTDKGLLNSEYKTVVKTTFKTSTQKSIFGIRQRLKSSQFNMVNHTAAILKLSVFAIALLVIF